MSETASLVIAVDSTDADRAVKSLRDLAQQGKVTESSLKQTGDSSRNLKRVSNEAESAARSMGLLESAAKGVVAALSIREIVGAVDGYTQLTAQIKLVTNSTQEYARAYQSVRDIARTTQADLSSTAMLYARIANATKELGVSQQTVADITEAVNLSLRVSGASAAEASSAMLQLSQAFAGGVLRGEEFNAVIESSPRLIQALAEGMGVTVGQMRSLAADGEITAEVMANVLPQALGKLRDEAQHVQTISGAFQNLKNEVLELIGTQAQATGFTTAVSAGLNLLANNLTTVVTIAGMLATARVAGAIAGITKEILGLGSAAAVARRGMGLLGGGFGLLAGVLAGGVMAWMSYRESVNATRKALTDVNAPIDDLIKKFKELSTLEQQAAIRGLAEAAKDAEKELAEAFESLAKVPGRLRAHPAFKEFRQEIERIKDADLGVDELDKQVASLVGSFKEATPQAQKAHEAVERLGNAVINAAKKNEKLAQTQKAVAEITDTVGISLDRAAIAAARAAAGLNTKEWDTFIQKAEAAATTVGMTAQQLGEFQARAMGASEAQSQLAGVLHGMADTARQLEKATADKDFKAIKGAQDTLAALAQQEVQLRVNIRQAEAYAALLAMGLSQASALQGSQTEAELEGLRAMEEVLQRIQNLRDNIENNTKPSKSATSAAEKATKAINDQIKALQIQAATVGMAEDQVTLYKLATEGATKAQLASAKAALDARRAGELSLAVAKRRIDTSNDAIKAAAEEAQRNIDLAETFGLSAAGIEQLTVARLEYELARAEAAGADAEEIERLKILIALRQESMGALITLEQKERQKQQWEEWARDVEQIFQQVGQSLTDALFEGGKSARDLIKDLFKTLTLRVFIQPMMGQLQGWVTNSLGGMFGYQNPQQQSGGGFSFGGGSTFGAGAVSDLGGWMAGSSVQSVSDLGAKMVMSADKIAQIGGNVLGYGSAIYDLSQGKYASAALTAAGQAIGGPPLAMAGNFVGGIIDGLFDREPTTRREQRTQVEYAGGIFDVTKVDDRAPAGADAAARALAEQAVQTANDIFRQVGVDAAIDSFHAIMASSYKGDRDGVASGGRLRIGDRLVDIGIPDDENPTIKGFGGWSSAETLPRLATDIQLTVLEAFQAASDQLPSVLSAMLEGIDVRSLGEAEAQALAERFTLLTQGASAFLAAVEQMPFAELRDLSFDAAAGMVQFAGGLENLLTAQQTYYERFYSDAERHAYAVVQLTQALAEVGIEMPALTGSTEDMLASYRALVESLDLNTEAGQQAYVTLMQTAGAFADVAEFAGQAAAELERAAEEQRQAFQRLADQQRQAMQALRQSFVGLAGDALAAIQQHGQERIAKLSESFARTDAVFNAYRSQVQQLESQWGSLITTMQRSMRDLRGQVEASARLQYNQARAVISTALLTGKLPQTADLGEAIRVAQQGVTGGRYASEFDQREAYLKLANELEALQGIAQPELDTARASLAQLEKQYNRLRGIEDLSGLSLKQLEKQFAVALSAEAAARTQIEQIERQIAMAQLQYQQLVGINDELSTLPGALKALAKAIDAASRVPAESTAVNREARYLANNPDVLAAYVRGDWGVQTAEEAARYHWEKYGRYEGRSFDVGTPYVPYDMTANIHRGEIIIDPRSSDILRRYGIGVQGGGSSRETEQLLREQLAEVRQQNRYLYEIVKSGKRNERNTGDVAMAIAHGDSDGVLLVTY